MTFLLSFQKARKTTRAGLTATDTFKMLAFIQSFFRNGEYWTQGAYHRNDGSKCLVGAIQHMRAHKVVAIDDCEFWILSAIKEQQPACLAIESFNDTRQSYEQVADLLLRAKQLAAARAAANSAPKAAVTHEKARPASRQPLALEHTVRLGPGLDVRQPAPARLRLRG